MCIQKMFSACCSECGLSVSALLFWNSFHWLFSRACNKTCLKCNRISCSKYARALRARFKRFRLSCLLLAYGFPSTLIFNFPRGGPLALCCMSNQKRETCWLIFLTLQLSFSDQSLILEDGEFVVGCLVNHRFTRTKGRQYSVRWAKHGRQDDSWEDAEKFNDATLLNNYWSRLSAKERTMFGVRKTCVSPWVSGSLQKSRTTGHSSARLLLNFFCWACEYEGQIWGVLHGRTRMADGLTGEVSLV